MPIVWTFSMNGQQADAALPGRMTLSVAWDFLQTRTSTEHRYIVRVFGKQLKMRARTMDEGKEMALAAARRIVADLAKALAEPEPAEPAPAQAEA